MAIYLPAEPSPLPVSSRRGQPDSTADKSTLENKKKLRVLLAEDDPLAAIGLRLLITNLGYQVIAEARTGYEAIEQVTAKQPDLILMDVKMPGMDGIEATRMIMKQRAIPIILVTAYHDQDTIDQGKQAGAVAYLIKPVSEYELKEAIQAAAKRFQ